MRPTWLWSYLLPWCTRHPIVLKFSIPYLLLSSIYFHKNVWFKSWYNGLINVTNFVWVCPKYLCVTNWYDVGRSLLLICHVDSVGEFGSCEKQRVNVSWPQYDMISHIFYMSHLSYKSNFLFIYRRRKT